MTFLNNVISYFHEYFLITSVSAVDIIEILIIAFIFYELMIWFKKTQAWALFKGILTILILILLAAIFNFTTILWIASNTLSVGVIALIIIFQPELRRALEQLGQRSIFKGILGNVKNQSFITDHTQLEIVEAVMELSQAKTGALICIERNVGLAEFENTGITIDSSISRQLLINIFEDKTPLHDGAVIIRENRIVAATCYLPMSENLGISKKYGTRHRAAVGLSEVSDAFTIVVSEETGHISLALDGELIENISIPDLRSRLLEMQEGNSSRERFIDKIKKGRKNDEV